MTTTEQTPTPERVVTFRESSDFKSIYANWIQTSFGPFDISMVFGDVQVSEATFEIEKRIRVQLHPAEIKILLAMLAGVIQNYENHFGKIILPANVSDEYGAKESEEDAAEKTTEGV